MLTFRALVVDDERYAREELIYLLKAYPSIDVVGEAENGESAILKTLQLQPDIVFLDIEMPKTSGMEVAKSLKGLKKAPLIIFATAYPQFAAEAFLVNATDYLLKPYDEGRLKQTMQRIEKELFPVPSADSIHTLGKLAVEIDGEINYVRLEELLYMFRKDGMTILVTKQRDYEVRMPLKELESRLTPYSFFRIHKGYLVNLQYVNRLTPWFHGAYQLELKGREEKLAVSRNYVKGLRQRLEL